MMQLKQKFIEAIAHLKSSPLNKNYNKQAALYAIPWYLIIGKPSSGKTTLLHNAKINISYETLSKNKLDSHLINKCNFEFCFANEAVFIDTSNLRSGYY